MYSYILQLLISYVRVTQRFNLLQRKALYKYMIRMQWFAVSNKIIYIYVWTSFDLIRDRPTYEWFPRFDWVPYNTHSAIVTKLGGYISSRLERRLARFLFGLINHDNAVGKYITKFKLSSPHSTLVDNYKYLLYKLYI